MKVSINCSTCWFSVFFRYPLAQHSAKPNHPFPHFHHCTRTWWYLRTAHQRGAFSPGGKRHYVFMLHNCMDDLWMLPALSLPVESKTPYLIMFDHCPENDNPPQSLDSIHPSLRTCNTGDRLRDPCKGRSSLRPQGSSSHLVKRATEAGRQVWHGYDGCKMNIKSYNWFARGTMAARVLDHEGRLSEARQNCSCLRIKHLHEQAFQINSSYEISSSACR